MKEVFSVIILHYNQPDYLYTAIDSVLAQSYPAIQLIFSDDGSLDFSVENIERYIHEKKQKNIIDFKVIRHQKNVGTVKNLNEAYSQCIGKYVLQFAADDALYDSEVLAQFSRALNNVSKETIGVCARSLDCDENLVWTGKEYLAPDKAEYFSLLTAEEQYRKFNYRCDIHMGSTAFIMDKLREILPLDQKYHLLDDWPLILRITRGGGRFSFADFKALLYRAGGVSRPLKERDIRLTRYICQDHLRVFEQEIFPYSKRLNLKELCDITKRYDHDRKWMKRATGEFESRRRIEILSNDKRFLLRMIKKIISYQGLLTVVLGILLLNCLLNYLDKMVLFFLLICFVAVMLQDLLQIKRYLFNTY